jgi:hypothetical protein
LSEPDRNRISAKLWRLPGEFLLALINAANALGITVPLPLSGRADELIE